MWSEWAQLDQQNADEANVERMGVIFDKPIVD